MIKLFDVLILRHELQCSHLLYLCFTLPLRNLDSVESMSMLVGAKSFKTKSKAGKTKKPLYVDVE